MSRLDKIRQYGRRNPSSNEEKIERLDSILRIKEEEIERRIDIAIDYINKELLPRINEFVETAAECEKNGIHVSEFYNKKGELKNINDEYTDYIDEYLKFICVEDRKVVDIIGITITSSDTEYIGVENGELFISSNNSVDMLRLLDEFITQYEQFEKCVYEYIDDIVD